ncbi:MAG: endonuclease MutS2, partial [Fusobacteria bacterium]|nr:endonuclease MutS2 [Fusobacteriota bacterium]
MNVKKVLEFDKIVRAISENAILETTQEKILALEPGLERRFIEAQLLRVQDLKDLIVYDEGILISDIIDIEKVIIPKLAQIGNILSEGELYLLKESLKSFRQAKNKILSLEVKYKHLYGHYHLAPTYKPLEDLIERIVDENREIKKDATLELATIMEQQKSLKTQIKRKLEEIMSEKEYEHALQDRIITIRNERFVVPIKATHKGHIKAIEHDRSESSMTVFMEPMVVVSLNNRVRELKVREKDETRKILIRITDQLRIHSDGLQKTHEFLVQLDFDQSLAHFMKEIQGAVPEITGGANLALFKARHPLLAKENVVPVDVSIGRDQPLFLITGPNTGGKTVLLKTMGLLSMMALSGIAIPASEKSIIPLFDNIYADIGDEQSIEQSLSSFSGHLKNIQEIFSKATERSMILLDELCSGTDPVEGAALAMAMVEHIEKIGCKAVI